MKKIARSAIKSVDIQAAPESVFAFLSDALNWPQYAIVNLRSVSPGQNGWFKAVTKFGEGELKLNPVKEFGILDHTWKDPQASWQVYSRVVPNGDGSTVTMTLFQPPVMGDQQFDYAMKEMDTEMNKLKEILERSDDGAGGGS
jgi:Polyketide cyclase / dehydrase and lipid transport